MNYGIGELLRKGREIEDEEQRIEFLRKNFSPSFGKMIEYALEPEYQWDLPPGIPPYKENKYLDQQSNLYAEVRRMYIFMKDTGAHVAPAKKEINFIQLLENVDPDDALFLLHAKEKTLPFGYTAAEIRTIFPGLIWDTTVEGTADFTQMTDEEMGKSQEPEVEIEPEPIDEAAIEAALIQAMQSPTVFVQQVEEPEQPAVETPVVKEVKKAPAKKPATRKPKRGSAKATATKSTTRRKPKAGTTE